MIFQRMRWIDTFAAANAALELAYLRPRAVRRTWQICGVFTVLEAVISLSLIQTVVIATMIGVVMYAALNVGHLIRFKHHQHDRIAAQYAWLLHLRWLMMPWLTVLPCACVLLVVGVLDRCVIDSPLSHGQWHSLTNAVAILLFLVWGLTLLPWYLVWLVRWERTKIQLNVRTSRAALESLMVLVVYGASIAFGLALGAVTTASIISLTNGHWGKSFFSR